MSWPSNGRCSGRPASRRTPGARRSREGGQGAVDAPLEVLAHEGDLVQQAVEAGAVAHVGGVEPQAGQARQLRHVGAVARPLSLRMMTARLSEWPRLLRPSNAMPPVSEPSPMTATSRRS